MPSPKADNERSAVKAGASSSTWRQIALEVVATTLLLAAMCWSPPPNVNESHYLTKAKHFWDPSWCTSDLFLSSADVHWVSFACFGASALVFDLEATAWIGRVVCWLTVAIGCVVLARTCWGVSWYGPVLAGVAVVLNRYFQLSGEWFVGGAEGKTITYALLLLALSAAVARRWWLAWVLIGVGSSFHVLVGGWAAIALAGTYVLQRERPGISDVVGALCGFTLALPGLIPALMQNWGTDPETVFQASQIQVYSRLSHHLNFGDFGLGRLACFGTMTVGLLALLIRDRSCHHSQTVGLFACMSLGLSAIGVLLWSSYGGQDPNRMVTRLLALYWFRLADVAVPIALAVCVINLASKKRPSTPDNALGARIEKSILPVCLLAIGVATAMHNIQIAVEPRPPAVAQAQPDRSRGRRHAVETFRNWTKVCLWIRENTPRESVFVTFRSQQTFKWYAQRAEVACWKDMPQDAVSIVEWNRRMQELYFELPEEPFGLLAHDDSRLVALAKQYGATHLLVWQRHDDLRVRIGEPVNLTRIYPEDPDSRSTFVVYRLED